jgi:hypothetical protein
VALPKYLTDSSKWYLPVDYVSDSSKWYLPGDYVYYGFKSYDPTRYQKEKQMKPGPFKSSTHGPIKVSMKARELLLANQLAAQNAITDGDYNYNNQALSRSRGELAKYISGLEANPKLYGLRHTDALIDDPVTVPRWTRYPYIGLDLAAGVGKTLYDTYFPKPIKENPMTDAKKTGLPKIPEIEKTRSQLIAEATGELLSAQQNLESISGANAGRPSDIRLLTSVIGSQYELNAAIGDLVKEQWAALAKKATARAKARVAKAEKAVAFLLD